MEVMNFTLTTQMIDKIAFAMEDQKERYVVDVDTGELVPLSAHSGALPEDRYVQLPRWGSAEGFHLMESFVTSLDNPAHRAELAHALTMGKGVFRAFKDALKASKIEKLWFDYKERRLRGIIVSWYNANREARGLAQLPVEPEETEELVMSDFSFTWSVKEHGEDILRLDRDAFFELFPGESPERLQERYSEKRSGVPALGAREAPLLIAETPEGELAGFAWGLIEGHSVHIIQLAIVPGLRGIGLGEVIVKKYLTDMRSRDMVRLTLELAGQVPTVLQLFPVRGVPTRNPGPGVQPGRAALLTGGLLRELSAFSQDDARGLAEACRAISLRDELGRMLDTRQEGADVAHPNRVREALEQRLVVRRVTKEDGRFSKLGELCRWGVFLEERSGPRELVEISNPEVHVDAGNLEVDALLLEDAAYGVYFLRRQGRHVLAVVDGYVAYSKGLVRGKGGPGDFLQDTGCHAPKVRSPGV